MEGTEFDEGGWDGTINGRDGTIDGQGSTAKRENGKKTAIFRALQNRVNRPGYMRFGLYCAGLRWRYFDPPPVERIPGFMRSESRDAARAVKRASSITFILQLNGVLHPLTYLKLSCT